MQPTQPRFHPVPLALAVALALGAPSFAHAQAASASGKVISLSIAAQPLGAALNELSAATGTAIGFPPALVAGKTAHAVKGDLTVRQAVDQLLRGTGLVAVREGDGIVIKAAPPASGDSVGELAAVTVTAQAEREGTTEGTGSYTQSGPTSTATGLSMSLRETPQSVTVVTRQKMDDFDLNTLEQVLDQTPGVHVLRQGDAVQFEARGGTIDNFQSDGTRSGQSYYSPGAPMPNNFAGDEMADMDRVEILKGSAGLLQGDGQPTATVNMIRKKPTREFQAHISSGIGSWDTYRVEADISGALNEAGTVRGRLVASYKDGNSYRDNVSNKYGLLYGTVDIDLTPETKLNIGFDYKDHRNTGNSDYMGAMVYDTAGKYVGLTSRSWNAAPAWSGFKRQTTVAFATLDHRFTDDWKVKMNISREDMRIPEWMQGRVKGPGEPFDYANKYDGMRSKTENLTIDLAGAFSAFGRKHEVLAGLNYSRNHYRLDFLFADNWGPGNSNWDNYASSFNYLLEGGANLPAPADNDTWSLYAQYRSDTIRRGAYVATRLSVTDDLKAIVGTRVSDYIYNYTEQYYWSGSTWGDRTNYRHKGILTPYAGLVYDIGKNTSLYASYANVFQPTSLQDEQGKVLKPQEGTTYEVGAKSELYGGRLNVGLAHFWKRWESYYELSGGLTPTGGEAYRNVNGAMERGYELEISGELAPGWQVQGSYVLNNSSIGSSGNFIRPKQQFKLYSTYRFSDNLTGLTVGGGARWQSKIVNSTYATLEQSPYWVFDLMARYRFDRHWSASVNVANVFDKKYFAGVYAMNGWGMYATWGAPRSISANLRYDF